MEQTNSGRIATVAQTVAGEDNAMLIEELETPVKEEARPGGDDFQPPSGRLDLKRMEEMEKMIMQQ